MHGDGTGNPWSPRCPYGSLLVDIEVEFTDEEYAMIEAAAAVKSETVQEFCERAIHELVARLRIATDNLK